jgi:hypothetical protein
MKTHELAKALKALAIILENGPNVNFTENTDLLGVKSKKFSSDELAVNLHTLVALSKIDKRQWTSFISEFNFPINYNDRDSTRNILGKIMSYLDENPNAVSMLKNKTKKNMSTNQSALTEALNILLKD